MSQNSQSLLLFFDDPQLRSRSEHLLEALKDVDPDDLTPRGALDALYRLKGLLKGSKRAVLQSIW